MQCQSCNNTDLTHVLSLGYMPPVNDMRPINVSATAQHWLPTDLLYCSNCELVQLECIADPEVVFPAHYPYTSGSTKILRDNFVELAHEACDLIDLKKDDLVVDIGSNDGTLLANFKDKAEILGVEPTAIAFVAHRRGIRTERRFFARDTGRWIAEKYGQAKIVTAANVFAHIDDIHGIIESIIDLMADDGVFISESHYLMTLIERLQYDTIYHEHLRYYSVTSLRNLLKQHGLHIFYVKRIPTHGGSIRVYARKEKSSAVNSKLSYPMMFEQTGDKLLAKLFAFASDVQLSKLNLMNALYLIKRSGGKICGISAPSRASTVVSYCRLDNSLVDFVAEVDGSLKIGKYMPGTDIPVVNEQELLERQPDFAILFSWHIADMLIPKLREKGYKGQFILPCARGTRLETKAA